MTFRRAQWRFIVASGIGYAAFYLTRKNLSMAQPLMLDEGVISTEWMGIILTVHGILYGLSRFANGLFADRVNGRVFMAIGLVLSAAMNFAFGCVTLPALFAVFWIANGWTQGFGSPACARMIPRWIHPKELSSVYAVWNTSHNVGALAALGICTALVALGFGWRWCFYVPAALTALGALFCWLCVKDSPEEAGFPPLDLGEPAKAAGAAVDSKTRFRLVFCNRVIWLVAIANFFVYVVRFGFLDWGPTFLKQCKGVPVEKGGLMIIAFEFAAVVGTIVTGRLTDVLFRGRGPRMCFFCMLLAALCAFGFWYLPAGSSLWASTALLMGAGFFIYSPQSLIGVIALNQATREAGALATGFTGITGYAATTVSGIGVALVKEAFGWGFTLAAIAGCAVVGMILFLFAWNAKADGYSSKGN